MEILDYILFYILLKKCCIHMEMSQLPLKSCQIYDYAWRLWPFRRDRSFVLLLALAFTKDCHNLVSFYDNKEVLKTYS